jgi:acyl-CoA synthetase (AMP-forming)/AMP-acid ligase II
MATNLWDAFRATAARRGEEPAFLRGGVAVSFAEFRRRAGDFAARFRRMGVGSGDRVLIWATNEPDLAAAIAATWAIGGIAALIDSANREAQLRHAVAAVSPKLVVHSPTQALPETPEGVAHLATDAVGEELAGEEVRSPSLPTDPASIVFTSGSTGRPKGVVQPHGNLLRGCLAVAGYLGLRPDDRILCPVPWSFDYGYGQLLSTIVLGATHVLPSQANPFGICRSIVEDAPTVLAGVPSLYTYLIQGVSPIRQTPCESVRILTSSGGRVPGPVLAGLRAIFAHSRIFLNYGLTETYRTCYLDPELLDTRGDSIGRPIPGVDVIIMGEDGRPAPPREVGEIVHRGDYICLGYWGDPAATARAIRPDPLALPGCPTHGRALFTGDYGYRDEDGFIYFQGRRDHQLKSMGVRVSPVEVEEMLYASGLVSEAAVFGMPHDLLGHEIWAAVVLSGGGEDVRRELGNYVRRTMSPYMQPRRFLFVEALPRTTTRKVDYPTLQAEAARVPSASLTK